MSNPPLAVRNQFRAVACGVRVCVRAVACVWASVRTHARPRRVRAGEPAWARTHARTPRLVRLHAAARTHARMHARTHAAARAHARTHARTPRHARSHARLHARRRGTHARRCTYAAPPPLLSAPLRQQRLCLLLPEQPAGETARWLRLLVAEAAG